MNYRPKILLDPLSSLFGGGSSTSSAATTNQQVGAQGNSGPVFGAITTKGGAISQKPSNSNTKTGTSGSGPSRNAPHAPTLDVNPSGVGGGQAAGPSNANAGGGSGNVNISVISGDSIAEQHNTDIATTSIEQNTELASKALDLASGFASLSFGLASQAQAGVNQNASDVLQAGQNLAAIGIGTQVAESLISPTGGAAVQPDAGNLNNGLLIGLMAVGLILILK